MKLSDRIEQMVHPGLPVEIDTLLGNWFGDKPGSCKSAVRTFMPRTNIVEKEESFVISLELPGVDVTNVDVEASDDKLKISGEKKIELEDESDKLHRGERVAGKFERSFEFPTQVDFESIQADFQHGVLTVSIPKSAKVLPRKIQINAGSSS